VFSGAGLAAGVTVGALLAADMLSTSSLSGLPAALFTAGSAGAVLQPLAARDDALAEFLTGRTDGLPPTRINSASRRKAPTLHG
jgi:hypothetical protein